MVNGRREGSRDVRTVKGSSGVCHASPRSPHSPHGVLPLTTSTAKRRTGSLQDAAMQCVCWEVEHTHTHAHTHIQTKRTDSIWVSGWVVLTRGSGHSAGHGVWFPGLRLVRVGGAWQLMQGRAGENTAGRDYGYLLLLYRRNPVCVLIQRCRTPYSTSCLLCKHCELHPQIPRTFQPCRRLAHHHITHSARPSSLVAQ